MEIQKKHKADDDVKKTSKKKLEGGKTRKRSNENSFGNKLCDNEKAFGKERQKSNYERKDSLNPEKNGTDTIDIRVDTCGSLIQFKMRDDSQCTIDATISRLHSLMLKNVPAIFDQTMRIFFG